MSKKALEPSSTLLAPVGVRGGFIISRRTSWKPPPVLHFKRPTCSVRPRPLYPSASRVPCQLAACLAMGQGGGARRVWLSSRLLSEYFIKRWRRVKEEVSREGWNKKLRNGQSVVYCLGFYTDLYLSSTLYFHPPATPTPPLSGIMKQSNPQVVEVVHSDTQTLK